MVQEDKCSDSVSLGLSAFWAFCLSAFLRTPTKEVSVSWVLSLCCGVRSQLRSTLTKSPISESQLDVISGQATEELNSASEGLHVAVVLWDFPAASRVRDIFPYQSIEYGWRNNPDIICQGVRSECLKLKLVSFRRWVPLNISSEGLIESADCECG